MSLARAWSVSLVGVEGHLVEIEVDLAQGLPGLTMVGLPDTALQEARDRIRAAIVNSGESWPSRRITVGLSPASLPKRGSGFDLAIAAAVLAAAGAVPADALAGRLLLGELGLDGRVRPVRGVLPAVLAATGAGIDRVVVAAANAAEAALVPAVTVDAVLSLSGLLALLRGEPVAVADVDTAAPDPPADTGSCGDGRGLDLADVVGQPEGRRAVEVAAAGGHHLFLYGPPGAGKTMLAERLPGVLPRLDRRSALEVTAVHSVAGTLPAGCPLLSVPPYCGPHHTATVAALIGGGSGIARPGAASLAHRGVLFLDEAPEFAPHALDALRQPLESGEVVISRAGGTARYPARFTLVLAANPCPCANATSSASECTCTPNARRRYLGRLSGPLLDRIDLRVQLLPVDRAALLADRRLVEPTATVAERVAEARVRSTARLLGTPWRTTSEIPGRELLGVFSPTPEGRSVVETGLLRGQLSARGLDRVLRVAWTLADLDEVDRPGADQVHEALLLRTGAAA